MSKKLFNLDSCDALNPSLSCFGVPRTDLAPGEEDAWAVYTSGHTSSVFIIKTANSRDGGVLANDVVSVLADFLSIWCMLLALFRHFPMLLRCRSQYSFPSPVPLLSWSRTPTTSPLVSPCVCPRERYS